MSDCPLCAKLARLSEGGPDEVVWQFPHSVALLGPSQYYTGYCILVARTHACELSQLLEVERHAYLEEMCLLARAIEMAFTPRKLNYELLGNQVPHLHWHVFPRSLNDDDPLRPVWFALDAAERDEVEARRLRTAALPRTEIVDRLRQQLALLARHTNTGLVP